MRDATGLTFGVTSFYAYNILQNVVTGKLQREISLRNYAECRRLTAATNLLHRHCGEALHLFLEHEAGLVFLILDQFTVADDLAQLGDSRTPPRDINS